MTIITLLSATHCGGADVAARVAGSTGWPLRTDDDLVGLVSSSHGVAPDKLLRVMRGPRSVFDGITHDWEIHVSLLREAMARLIQDDPLVFHGDGALLVPRTVGHVMRVCLVARPETRLANATRGQELSEAQAQRQMSVRDAALGRWSNVLVGLGPWDASLFDLLLPMDDSDADAAALAICTHANNPAVLTTATSKQALAEFQLAALVLAALGTKGRDVEATADGDTVTLTINRYVMRLQHLEGQLVKIAKQVPGVRAVSTRVGPHFHQPNIYGELELDVPRKILLVDDEVEFVQTLSERLQTRNLESVVAFDGEQALAIAEADAPDVMVLDMKMPGIDGMDVLRRVKSRHPQTEVIVLTAHGSDRDKDVAMALGAFAYLRKPADIDDLARLMKEAYAKVQAVPSSEADGADADAEGEEG